jgi:hypothetical protein
MKDSKPMIPEIEPKLIPNVNEPNEMKTAITRLCGLTMLDRRRWGNNR